MRQARYWIGTIPRDDWEPRLPDGAAYCGGQPEVGETGYRHWQILVAFARKRTLRQVKSAFPRSAHLEPTRSDAARAYVFKESTRDGEQFVFGEYPINRNSGTDWARVKTLAQTGSIDQVPDDIYIRYYRTLCTIAADHEKVSGYEKHVNLYYGRTGTGKSMLAFEEAGSDVYVKDPRSKFWCGYRGECNVVIDEFRGGIDVSHMLRWLDRYPVRVEVKGSSRPLKAKNIWITSNLHPDNWYPDMDEETKSALKRRMNIRMFE